MGYHSIEFHLGVLRTVAVMMRFDSHYIAFREFAQ